MGMPESSFLEMVRERVSEVSQFGLTHELGLEFVVVGSLLSMEALREEMEWNGAARLGGGIGWREKEENDERE